MERNLNEVLEERDGLLREVAGYGVKKQEDIMKLEDMMKGQIMEKQNMMWRT